MKPPEYYRGREQTYLKHFFLEKYLERVAYNILSFRDDFVYVDGFSGPWKSEDEAFEDTSFVIALNELRKIRDGFEKRGRQVNMRCLFIEKNPEAFAQLDKRIESIEDIQIKALHGSFEYLIPKIIEFIGPSFSLVFIDPKGWTEFGLKEIEPVLRHQPGEILLNFMFDHLNRFLDDPRSESTTTFDLLFGDNGWHLDIQNMINSGSNREEAILQAYRERFRLVGNFKHVTSTRILKPLADRSYFHLVYGTRHWKGLDEFRGVEKKVVDEQERVRDAAKHSYRIERTGQTELFGHDELSKNPLTFENERIHQLETASANLRAMLSQSSRVSYENVLGHILELPLVWKSDVNRLLKEMYSSGEIQYEGKKGRSSTPQRGTIIMLRRN